MQTKTSPLFDAFIPWVESHEAVYKKGHYGDDAFVLVERDPSDSGGTTKWGLDAGTHGEGVANLSWAEARQIYWDWYWCGQTKGTKWISADTLAPGLAEVVFDTRINSGMGIAKRFLSATQDPLAFLDLRDARNRWLAKEYPKDQKYLEGWLNRTGDLRARLTL